jgi:hypothetical protein
MAVVVLGAGQAQALTISIFNSFQFGGKSYRTYLASQAITWTQARTFALGLGGGFDLVSINSAAENAAINSNIQPPSASAIYEGVNAGPYIGAYRPANSNNWSSGIWVDGSSLNYTNWQNGQPDNNGQNGGIVAFINWPTNSCSGSTCPQFLGQWHDTFDSLVYPSRSFIVESPPVPSPLPLFGSAAAFGFSRKLRKRINLSKSS